MKKKILLLSLLISLFIVVFAMVASAETPELYVEFDVKLEGNQDYTTVYVKNTEGGNPRVNLTYDFYSDVEFTQAVDKATIVAMDFSGAVHYGNSKDYVDRFTTASADVFPKCEEIKWFSRTFTSIPSKLFNGWAQLKRFDFGCATMVDYNLLTGTGIENIVIPASVTNLNNGVFQNCTSLKTVKIEGAITKMGSNEFYGCTSLTSVDLGATTILGENMFQGCTALTELEIPSTVTQINKQAMYNCTSLKTVKLSSLPYISEGMFYKCTSLESIELPSSITEIKGNAFRECSGLKSITIPEGVTKIGNLAFYKTAITSLHIPANVESLGYQVAEETPIESLTFAENSKLTFIDHRAFYNCDSLVGPVILPDGLVEIDYGLFSGCAKLKAVKMPDSVTTLSGDSALFSQCPELEFVQFSKNITSICKSMFEGCKSLKAISLPDNITTIDYKAFRDCTSLEAVYLPSSLTNLGSVSDSSTDWGTFYQSGKVYFVQESFEVFNGNELLGDKFVMPEKPEVYYMPSGLVSVANSEFQNCKNLNNFIVFPEGVTSLDGVKQGSFFNIGANRASNPVTLVFLGDITSLIIRQNDTTYSNVHFVFAHPNDKDLNSLTLTIGAANNKTQTNTYMYFCAGNTVYDLSTFKAANAAAYTVKETDFTKTVNEEGAQPHFADIKKTELVDPTCLDNKKQVTYCFCGDKIGESDIENTALGHSHTVYVDMVYESLMADGYISYKCERCTDVNNETVAEALFECLGYSSPEYDGNGFTISFTVNKSAVAIYEANKGAITYGAFAVAKSKLGASDVLKADGTPVDYAIKAEVSKEFTAFDLKISGFNTDDQKSALLALGAYVISGDKIIYLQKGTPIENEKYTFVSYNDVTAQSSKEN